MVERDGIKRLECTFKFRDFVQALAFTNQVGGIAEEEGRHPVIEPTWGCAAVTWYTHQNDFIMAAKTDELYSSHSVSSGK